MADEDKKAAPDQVNGAEVAGAMPPEMLQHKLTKPIQANGETVTVLQWREPTAADIERAGNPIVLDLYSFGGDEPPKITYDEKKMSAMISVLAAIPPSSVRMIPAGDWHAIAIKLTRFFMPAMGA